MVSITTKIMGGVSISAVLVAVIFYFSPLMEVLLVNATQIFSIQHCPAIFVPMNSLIINTTGFKVQDYMGLKIYLLNRGDDGTITYQINRGSYQYTPQTMEDLPESVSEEQTITNNAMFSYGEKKTVHQNVTEKQIVLENGTVVTGFEACYKHPQSSAIVCRSGIGSKPSEEVDVELIHNDHLGVEVSFEPKSVTLGYNSSKIITATITTTQDAPHKAYMFSLSPGKCNGGLVIPLVIN
jgi:hypothetical protein